jgi:hypothetical protein
MTDHINELRLIPAGTMVRSISLQLECSFRHDVVVEVKHQTYNDDTWCFGNIQLIFVHFNCPSGNTDMANGEISFNYNDSLPYVLPDYYFDINYSC